jgi:hypothetical protein
MFKNEGTMFYTQDIYRTLKYQDLDLMEIQD